MATYRVFGIPIQVVKQSATPAAPDAGYLGIYPKSDDKWYQQTPAGVETQLGSGGGAGADFAFFMNS